MFVDVGHLQEVGLALNRTSPSSGSLFHKLTHCPSLLKDPKWEMAEEKPNGKCGVQRIKYLWR